jgi:enoyl-CoA hydratase/carnithine racemase
MSSDDASQVEMRLDERRGGLVAVVTVNNASRLNAMHSALMDEFVERLSPLMADAELRALVLTGAGDKAFIGGADIREMSALTNAEDGRRFITRLHRCCDAIRALPVPTIARINGLTLGGGLEMAAACDVRIAAQSAVRNAGGQVGLRPLLSFGKNLHVAGHVVLVFTAKNPCSALSISAVSSPVGNRCP